MRILINNIGDCDVWEFLIFKFEIVYFFSVFSFLVILGNCWLGRVLLVDRIELF